MGHSGFTVKIKLDNKSKIRKTVFIVLSQRHAFFLILTLFCASCQLGCKAAPKTPKDTLVVGLEAAPLTLDPRMASDAYSAKITHLIHNGLFRLSERLEVTPDLAAS